MLQVLPPSRQRQVTRSLFMVRPARFGANPLTAESNAFQGALASEQAQAVAEAARAEFDAFVALLRAKGVEVWVGEDTDLPHTPDAVFPNNWVSFHAGARVVLYPMMAENRRLERRPDLLEAITHSWPSLEVVDLSPLEARGHFLEGTGSMALDRVNRIAYACRSPRTTPEGFEAFCAALGYEPMLFDATDAAGKPIYHTNVMMAIGESVAVVCLESITQEAERSQVAHRLAVTGHEVVDIRLTQVQAFAGNMLEIEGAGGLRYMVMSQRAFESLDSAQIDVIASHAEPLVVALDVIETYGGGSVRCMMAEVFSPI